MKKMKMEAKRVVANDNVAAHDAAAAYYDGGWRFGDESLLAQEWLSDPSGEYFPEGLTELTEEDKDFLREVMGWLASFELDASRE